MGSYRKEVFISWRYVLLLVGGRASGRLWQGKGERANRGKDGTKMYNFSFQFPFIVGASKASLGLANTGRICYEMGVSQRVSFKVTLRATHYNVQCWCTVHNFVRFIQQRHEERCAMSASPFVTGRVFVYVVCFH